MRLENELRELAERCAVMKVVETVVPVGQGHICLTETEAVVPRQGTVLLVPPFAMTARSMFPVALTLSANGFESVCVDGRDSLGKGSGKTFNFRMTTLAADVKRAVEVMQDRRTGGAPLIVVGLSLAARAVVRVGCGRACDGMILMTPVLHLRSTLTQVLGQDLFAVPDSELPASLRVLGQEVGREFIRDARDHDFVGLETCQAELRRIDTPLAMICGDEDPWVAIEEVRASVALLRPTPTLSVLRAASHELNRNPRVAMTYIEHLTAQCLAMVGREPSELIMPSFSEVIAERGRTEPEPNIAGQEHRQ
jgi:pimeloyl-ACP methyl ester carboxylesterase